MDYNCPNCGAPLKYHSSVSVYTTCTFCRSTIVRHDMDLEKLGEQAELLNDMSPFQVGTTGTFEGAGFMLLGRIKLVYEKGTWSEWYALFNDGRQGWLAEAQGRYMMSFPVENADLPPAKAVKLGGSLTLDSRTYVVDEIQKVRYAASEGELPFVFQKDFEAVSVDLRGGDGYFASILYGPDSPEIFMGRYETFDAFNFQMLRMLDGWTRT